MSNPYPIFGTQDVHDDDGQVIDSLFIETDAPPNIKDAVEPILIPVPVEPARPTRLLGGTEILDPGKSPYRLLPADADRLQLHLEVTLTSFGTATFNDYAVLGDDVGPVASAQSGLLTTQGCIRLRPGKSYEMDQLTGPVYIAPGNATSQLEVVWRAVTK